MYVLLMLVGGVLLIVGLIAPWYFSTEGGYHSISALGGNLVEAQGNFDPVGGYISLGIAIVSVLFSLASVRLSEASQRKYVAVLSFFTGVCALMNIVYLHFWLGTYFPGAALFSYGTNPSWGPTVGYFLTWVAIVLLFAATYTSGGLPKVPEKTKI
jgi:hypothetical protein